jgi:EAL domain-containing protein (putative c-di-GMP-specific phosphodiesterase class I)
VQAPHVAVNISARELGHGEFVARLENALAETGCDPSRLTIEITESLFIDADMIEVLRAVSATGVKLSIDDFGTGYSSLAYLRRLPLDYLKIDRSFVHDLPEDAEATALVTAIMSMAHALGLKVVAEGIETQAQLRHLHEQGCDLVQGFYLAVPMPGKDVASLLRARSRAIRERLVNGAGANQPG